MGNILCKKTISLPFKERSFKSANFDVLKEIFSYLSNGEFIRFVCVSKEYTNLFSKLKILDNYTINTDGLKLPARYNVKKILTFFSMKNFSLVLESSGSFSGVLPKKGLEQMIYVTTLTTDVSITLSFLPNLKKVIFIKEFISEVKFFPKKVEEIIFYTDTYGYDLCNWPENLKRLTIRSQMDNNDSKIILPSGLEFMDFGKTALEKLCSWSTTLNGKRFLRLKDEFSFPETLKELVVPTKFLYNKPYPPKLEKLRIGHQYSIDWMIVEGIKYISTSCDKLLLMGNDCIEYFETRFNRSTISYLPFNTKVLILTGLNNAELFAEFMESVQKFVNLHTLVYDGYFSISDEHLLILAKRGIKHMELCHFKRTNYYWKIDESFLSV